MFAVRPLGIRPALDWLATRLGRSHANVKVISFLVFLMNSQLIANDSFTVVAADASNRQLLSVFVNQTSNKIETNTGEPLKLPFGATSITRHPNGKRLIASSSSFKGASQVADIEILEGQLTLDHSSALKQPTGYTSVDRRGRFFLSSNYRSGGIAVYRINDGRVAERICSLKTPRAEAHCILTTPDNRFAYVPCVKNNNALYQFSFDQETGKLTPLKPFDAHPPAMFGPRHVAYHPTLPIAYFSNEQQLGVSVYGISEDGQLTGKQHATTLARRSPFVQGSRGLHASDLIVTSDGKRLFVAVRDFVGDEDSVFTFRIEKDGRLSLIARTRVGDIPWKLDISPNEKLLLVSESGDRQLAIFKIQPDGKLSRLAPVNWNVAVRDMVVVSGVANSK